MSDLYKLFLRDKTIHAHKYEHYFPVYERYFARFRNKPVNVLEIGVDRGGGLKLWQKYFGPKANIFGIDIMPECAKLTKGKVKIFIGSQSDKAFLADLLKKLPPLDVVIDDGSHVAKDIIAAFETIYPKMKKDGVYLIEDLQTSYWPRLDGHKKNKGFGRFFWHQGKLYTKGFAQYAAEKVHELNSMHQNYKSYTWFAVPRKQRKTKLKAADIAWNTKGIYFHDSMVVFERAENIEPLRIFK